MQKEKTYLVQGAVAGLLLGLLTRKSSKVAEYTNDDLFSLAVSGIAGGALGHIVKKTPVVQHLTISKTDVFVLTDSGASQNPISANPSLSNVVLPPLPPQALTSASAPVVSTRR